MEQTKKLEELFYPADILLILKIKPATSIPDLWTWKYNKLGDYSVKSGSWLASQEKNKEIIREAVMQPSINEIKKKYMDIKNTSKDQVIHVESCQWDHTSSW